MSVRVNNITEVNQIPEAAKTVEGDGSFKFTLASAITDADLQAKVDALLNDITAQGNRLAEHMDIRDMKRYRGLVKDFLNEVVYRSHKFSRENFLDRRGRHRVYGITEAYIIYVGKHCNSIFASIYNCICSNAICNKNRKKSRSGRYTKR